MYFDTRMGEKNDLFKIKDIYPYKSRKTPNQELKFSTAILEAERQPHRMGYHYLF